METTAALSLIQKSLGTLKAVPTWLLIAAFGSVLTIWLRPAAFTSVPESFLANVPALLWVTGISLTSKLISLGVGHAMERGKRSRARDRERLVNLYRPLASLFLTRHVTQSSGVGAPYFRQRLENARSELGAYRHRTAGMNRALRALFDKRISSSAEMEFGGEFPLSQVIELVIDQPEHVDTKLFALVAWAPRSRDEEPDRGILTEAELALFEHIHREHPRLAKQVN